MTLAAGQEFSLDLELHPAERLRDGRRSAGQRDSH